jgi:hypothetical protein
MIVGLQTRVNCQQRTSLMATATRITIEQYLKTPFEPDAEFVNGEIEERNVGEYDHSVVQRAILFWLHRHDKEWQTRTIQEQRTRLRSGNVRIPDVSVWKREAPIEPVFSHPPFIAIEVLSPEDRQSAFRARSRETDRLGLLRHQLDPKIALRNSRYPDLSRSRRTVQRIGRRGSVNTAHRIGCRRIVFSFSGAVRRGSLR